MQLDLSSIWITLKDLLVRYGVSVVAAGVIALLGWMAARWAGRGARRLAERSPRMGPTLAPVFSKAARLAVLAVALIAVLDKLGIDTTSLLAALGAFGLAVGLALKDTISDIASGIVLLVLRPFEAGDVVSIDGTGGTVESVDVFQTRLVSLEGVPLVLPNHKVRAARIENYSRASKRRIDLEVGIAYQASIDEAIGAVRALLEKDARVLSDPAPLVSSAELADSSVNLLVRFWTPATDWFLTKLDVLRKLKLELDRIGIEIPFPQRVITQRRDGKAA